MSLAKETRRCPFCKETIAATAIRCKHCHADLGNKTTTGKSWFRTYNTFRHGFITGILFTLILLLLVYLQMYWE